MRRLVVYAGLDGESISLIRKVRSYYRDLFDEVTIVQVPRLKDSAKDGLSIPSLVIEEHGVGRRIVVGRLNSLALSEFIKASISEAR